MIVFMTGATGFVGREVLRQLRAAGHSIRILARNSRSARVQDLATSYKAELREGNILDRQSLADALPGVDSVIHLVGIISEVGQNTFENVHSRGTANIVAAAREAGVNRFVHMSALGTRPNAASRYHQSKWAAEECVRGSGLGYTIFRPSLIYGPGDGFVNLFARMSRLSPLLPVLGDGRSRFQPVPVADVALCFAKALTEPRSVGQTYDLCGTETFPLDEIIDLILGVTGRRRLKLHVPVPLARTQATFLEFVFARFLRRAPPLTRDQLIMLQEDNVGDPRPAMELFGIKPRSFKDGIGQYLKRET